MSKEFRVLACGLVAAMFLGAPVAHARSLRMQMKWTQQAGGTVYVTGDVRLPASVVNGRQVELLVEQVEGPSPGSQQKVTASVDRSSRVSYIVRDLPPGAYQVRVWVDQDADQALSPGDLVGYYSSSGVATQAGATTVLRLDGKTRYLGRMNFGVAPLAAPPAAAVAVAPPEPPAAPPEPPAAPPEPPSPAAVSEPVAPPPPPAPAAAPPAAPPPPPAPALAAAAPAPPAPAPASKPAPRERSRLELQQRAKAGPPQAYTASGKEFQLKLIKDTPSQVVGLLASPLSITADSLEFPLLEDEEVSIFGSSKQVSGGFLKEDVKVKLGAQEFLLAAGQHVGFSFQRMGKREELKLSAGHLKDAVEVELAGQPVKIGGRVDVASLKLREVQLAGEQTLTLNGLALHLPDKTALKVREQSGQGLLITEFNLPPMQNFQVMSQRAPVTVDGKTLQVTEGHVEFDRATNKSYVDRLRLGADATFTIDGAEVKIDKSKWLSLTPEGKPTVPKGRGR